MLANFGIECFMAHDDIYVSEEWREKILDELNEVDIFVPILSDNFRSSEWCSQEAGIACFRKILIIPLSLDSNRPYGFMNKWQGRLIKQGNIPLNYLLKPINDKFPDFEVVKKLIDELEISSSYRNAEWNMNNLEPYFDELTSLEVNRIVEISIANNQIWPAGKCREEYLPKFIEINEDQIDKNKLNKLLELIKEN